MGGIAIAAASASASSESARLDRVAQSLSIEATTERINGELRFSYDYQGAYQTWKELDLMYTNADQLGDSARAQIYLSARDQLHDLSPLLQEPYFDAEALETDSGIHVLRSINEIKQTLSKYYTNYQIDDYKCTREKN